MSLDAFCRGWKARKRLKWLRKQHAKRRRYAALVIQRHYRSWRAGRYAQTKRGAAHQLPGETAAAAATCSSSMGPSDGWHGQRTESVVGDQAAAAGPVGPVISIGRGSGLGAPAVLQPSPGSLEPLSSLRCGSSGCLQTSASFGRSSLTDPSSPGLTSPTQWRLGPLVLPRAAPVPQHAAGDMPSPASSTPASCIRLPPSPSSSRATKVCPQLSPLKAGPVAGRSLQPCGSGGKHQLAPVQAPPAYGKPGTLRMQQQHLRASLPLPNQARTLPCKPPLQRGASHSGAGAVAASLAKGPPGDESEVPFIKGSRKVSPGLQGSKS